MVPELLSVRNYRMSGVSAKTESRLRGWMDTVYWASVSVMHHWRATDVQLNLLKDCVLCEDNLLRSVLAETFSAARIMFTFGPTLPSSLLFHYVMLWLVGTSMTARLVLLRASVFMVFVSVKITRWGHTVLPEPENCSSLERVSAPFQWT